MRKSSKPKRLSSVPCPGCGDLGLKRIIYGMPSDNFEFEKFIVGGCIMSDFDIACKKCGWTGERKKLMSHQIEIDKDGAIENPKP